MSGLNAGQWQDAIVDQICERIFVAMGAGNVQSAFDYFDVDGDGNIEYEEFVNALKALEIGLADDQIHKHVCVWSVWSAFQMCAIYATCGRCFNLTQDKQYQCQSGEQC